MGMFKSGFISPLMLDICFDPLFCGTSHLFLIIDIIVICMKAREEEFKYQFGTDVPFIPGWRMIDFRP